MAKLKDVMAARKADEAHLLGESVGLKGPIDPVKKPRVITTDEASLLSKIGMSGAEVNDKARRAMSHYLEALTLKDSIDDDEAKVAHDILKQAATVEQKELCNKVLLIYVSKFDFAQPGAAKAAEVKAAVAKEHPVAA